MGTQRLHLYYIPNLGERKFPPPPMLSIFSLSLSLAGELVGVIHCINKYKPHTNEMATDKNRFKLFAFELIINFV